MSTELLTCEYCKSLHHLQNCPNCGAPPRKRRVVDGSRKFVKLDVYSHGWLRTITVPEDSV